MAHRTGLHSKLLLSILLAAVLSTPVFTQNAPVTSQSARPAESDDSEFIHELLATQKAVDDLLWYQRLGDVAEIDKIRLTSTKPIRMSNPTGQGAGNPLIIYAKTFIPKKLEVKNKAPLIVLVHGGVHANFDSNYTHIIRELLNQGYIVIAPEYRGSTGFGQSFFEQIDYGGAEIDDTHSVRDWAVENLPQVDATRVGIIGWSHGGYHALLNIARWPKDYQVAYAGVPVSDLVMRMGYKGDDYNREFAKFIGKLAVNDPMEYRRRSPVFHAAEIQTPLLIHSNTNDEDVNVMEVEHMIAALKAAGKKFEYKIYENVPGAHQFNRIDTSFARQSRQEIYAFLAKYLKP
ncbi:MAG TPA: alpha/beta fold hydrolase [Clostridia bacterium]|nr:alpha/beta fold hydrolase [Clostridia bacterium]